MITEPNPNIYDALQELDFCSIRPNVNFGPYSPTYIVSNESLRYDIGYFKPQKLDNVLTVAASGDHPLWLKFKGAGNVTTFDITYNAKVIMNIKTAALSELNLNEYNQLLNDLWNNRKILSVNNIDCVLEHLSSRMVNYLQGINGEYPIFTYGHPASCPVCKLNDKDYKTMRQVVTAHFPFIWTDIANLDNKLEDKTYDFIHLSNIFDYTDHKTQKSVLQKLTKRLNPGGRILMLTMLHNDYYYNSKDVCDDIATKSHDLNFLDFKRDYVLEKTR